MTPYRLVASLRSALVLVMLAVIISAASAAALSLPDGATAARATIRLQPGEIIIGEVEPNDDARGDRYVANEIEVLEARAVRDRAVIDARYDLEDVSPDVTVEQVTGTDVVRVLLQAPAGYDTVLLLRAHLGVYFDQRRQATETVLSQRLSSLRARTAVLQRQVLAATDLNAPETVALRASVRDLQAQERELLQVGAGTSAVGQVIEPPTDVTTSGLRTTATAALVGALLALLASAGVLLIHEWVRRPVRRLEDITDLGLAAFPYVVSRVHRSVAVLTLPEAASVIAALQDPHEPPPRIVVTGADLRTDVALSEHLATALRERWPGITYCQRLEESESAVGELVAAGSAQPVSSEPQTVTPALPQAGGLVLVAEPPGYSPLCLQAARSSSLTLLLATAGRTSASDLEAAHGTLRRAGADVLVVLVLAD